MLAPLSRGNSLGAASVTRLDRTMISAFEDRVATFYVQTFFAYSGCAPLIPHVYLI